MFKKKKLPFPETTEECKNLLEAIISAIDSPLPSKQSDAYPLLEILYKRRCEKTLTWLYRNYSENPLPSKQQFAKKALEYRRARATHTKKSLGHSVNQEPSISDTSR